MNFKDGDKAIIKCITHTDNRTIPKSYLYEGRIVTLIHIRDNYWSYKGYLDDNKSFYFNDEHLIPLSFNKENLEDIIS